MPSFKEEHILLVVPGSKTTLAQLGLPESFGPPTLRVPTRVFLNEEGKYTPNKIRAKKVKVKKPSSLAARHAEPVIGNDGGLKPSLEQAGEHALQTAVEPQSSAVPDDSGAEITQHEEDADDEEGAIHPIVQGKIVDMEALLAVLAHIENLVDAPMHTPVLVVCDPAWSSEDKELITKFYFENKQRPGVTFLLSSLAVLAGYDATEGCVVDIGYDKTTISSIIGFYPVEESMFYANRIGGQRINETLIKARKAALSAGKIKGPEFTDTMAEQLKKQSYICEVLQPDVILPTETAEDNTAVAAVNPATIVHSGNESEKAANAATAPTNPARAPATNVQASGDAEENENEGVLDVASIVASGKASEILAKREQEKSEKVPRGGNKKGAPAESAKPVRLTNVQKVKVPFRYTERVKARDLHATASGEADAVSESEKASTTTHNDQDDGYVYANREIEVGTERFASCDEDNFLVPLCIAIWTSINNAPAEKRQELWNSLAIVGNGSKVKGLKEAILNYLNENYLIPPNNNTMFTSELPSHFSTPAATGANTPQPVLGQHGAATPISGAGSSSVNPLLLAATTASQAQNQGSQLAPPGQPYQASLQPGPSSQNAQIGQANSLLSLSHVSLHSPTTIKTLSPKDYYPEWKDHGFEEMAFLGSCVMARVVFILDTNQPANFMTRVQYNEEGPTGIHNYSLA